MAMTGIYTATAAAFPTLTDISSPNNVLVSPS